MGDFSIYISLEIVLFTLFLVLVERKFLSYSQRRLGPVFMGRNGLFQILYDLVKLVTKDIFLIPRPSSITMPLFTCLFFSFQLLFSQHFILNKNLFIYESLDSLILFHLILIIFSNLFFTLCGLLSQSRYAILGTIRGIVHLISLDIFITIIYSLLTFSSQSAHFNEYVLIQNQFNSFFLFLPLATSFILILILESKRTPFDHAETESEVVAGYAIEYSGPLLMIFYLAEYIHLIISSIHFVIFFLGGWFFFKLISFYNPIFIYPNFDFFYDMII